MFGSDFSESPTEPGSDFATQHRTQHQTLSLNDLAARDVVLDNLKTTIWRESDARVGRRYVHIFSGFVDELGVNRVRADIFPLLTREVRVNKILNRAARRGGTFRFCRVDLSAAGHRLSQ